jgi:hypothetical protein
MKIFIDTSVVSLMKALFIALLIAPQGLVAQCVYVDFTYTIEANGQVTFTDVSGITNPSSRIWSFGDGAINTATASNTVVHRYNIATATTPSVCFTVTLTESDGSNTGVSQPKQVCIPISTQSGGTSLFVKIVSPVAFYDGACNSDFSTIFVNQSTAFEASVLGGTPPYTYKWSFPPNTATNRTPYGQGPHIVTFSAATTGSCAPDLVSVDVTDAQGATGSALVKVSVKNEIEGPGPIKVVANKTTICVGDNVTFKVKVDNPFALGNFLSGITFSSHYKWLVDGNEYRNEPALRKIDKNFTEGAHTVGLEITDGGTTYRATPMTFIVKSAVACNIPTSTIPNFAIKVNGVIGGTLTLDARNNSNLCTDNSLTRKITVRVPKKPIFMDPSLNCGGDCLPFYFFEIEVRTSDGVRRKLRHPCGVNQNSTDYYIDNHRIPTNVDDRYSNTITEPFLTELGRSRTGNPMQYINNTEPGFIEFTLPICFANCGPLVGCNELNVTVGRFALGKDIYPNITDQCRVAFPDCSSSGYTNESFICTNNICGRVATKPLVGKVGLLSTLSCAIKVTDTYPPLSISGINIEPFTCSNSNSNYRFNITDKISGGIPFDLDPLTDYIDCGQGYKKVKWKAYYFSNPNREITGDAMGDFITPDATNSQIASVTNLNHTYFNSFGAGEQRLFIVEASVADWDGNVARYSMLVAFDAPLVITLPGSITRCKSDNVLLSTIPIVQGGTATTASPYRFEWSCATAAIFKTAGTTISTSTSTESNPLLNLSNVPLNTEFTLRVTDANGCSVSKTITIIIGSLKPPELAKSTLTACANSSSVLIIGPTNSGCVPNNLGTCLGGSGEYVFTWSVVKPENSADLDLLSDPTAAYPKVIGLPTSITDRTAQYKLTVSDLYGGCSEKSVDPVTVLSQETSFNVVGTNQIVCPSIGNPVTLRVQTMSSTPPREMTTGFTYKWESPNAPNFSTTATGNQIVLNNLPAGSNYTYKVTSIHQASNCSASTEMTVQTRKSWTYKGYEPVIAPLVAGHSGLLWANSNNEIQVNNTSGAVPSFSYTTTGQVTNITTGNYGAIAQGTFTPTGSASNVKIVQTDANGCTKEFMSNTYYVLSSNPNLVVSTDKKVVCSGGDICLYLKLNTNVLTGHKYLPTSFKVPFNLMQASLLTDGSWYYRTITPSNGEIVTLGGTVEFVLTDASAGIYAAVTCLKTPSVGQFGGSTKFVFLIDGGLPNYAVTGDGKFKVEHQFNATTSGPIRPDYRLAGYINRFYPRQVAYNFVSLGSEYYRSGSRFNDLQISGNAYTEFAASRVGEVRIEGSKSVRIDEGTRYFHAFIDPCLTPAGKLRDEDTDENAAYLLVKKPLAQELKGAFSVRPSPFVNTITLDYEIRTEKGSTVSLVVYNGIGQVVDRIFDNRFHSLGVYSTTYDTDKLRSGMYLFELTIDGEKIVKKSMKVD